MGNKSQIFNINLLSKNNYQLYSKHCSQAMLAFLFTDYTVLFTLNNLFLVGGVNHFILSMCYLRSKLASEKIKISQIVLLSCFKRLDGFYPNLGVISTQQLIIRKVYFFSSKYLDFDTNPQHYDLILNGLLIYFDIQLTN